MSARAGGRLAMIALALAAAGVAAPEDRPIPGLGPIGPLHQVHGGFVFTEGPAADRDGNLYFTDIRANRILKIDTQGRLATWLENSRGCNGLMVDGRRLVACQGEAGRIVSIDLRTRELRVVADRYAGKRFNRPNDLVIDRRGGVYFTDPVFNAEDQRQDRQAVYYAAANAPVVRVIDDLSRPNGVLLSPDEKTLYVVPAGTPEVMAYPVRSPGKLGPGRALVRLEQAPEGPTRGGDGLAADQKGNLYIAQPALSAIQVVSPQGQTLGFIRLPEHPTNCDFGGKDMKTLFITANTPPAAPGGAGTGSLYAVEMKVKGHRFR